MLNLQVTSYSTFSKDRNILLHELSKGKHQKCYDFDTADMLLNIVRNALCAKITVFQDIFHLVLMCGTAVKGDTMQDVLALISC